jgi:nitrate/nitrite transport system substrate-binding protein
MPIAANLGLDGLRVPMHAGLMLSRNGSSITVSSALYDEMGRPPPDPAASAAALRALIEDDRRKGRPRRVFAHVFPFSTHHYVLCDWMASAGIDPETDVWLGVIPPRLMVKMLRERRIDGFCVGAPWGAAAEEALIGRRLVATHRVRPGCAEKVLGVTSDWAALNPHTHLGVVAALIEACTWLDQPGNRAQAAIMLEASDWISAPPSTLRNALIDDGSDPRGPHIVFGTGESAEPADVYAGWFAQLMLGRGQVAARDDVEAIAERTYDRRFFGQAFAIAAASRGAAVTP